MALESGNSSRRDFVKGTAAAATAGVTLSAGCLGGNDVEYVDPIDVSEMPPEEYESQVNSWHYYNMWLEPLTDGFQDEYDIDLAHNFTTADGEYLTELRAGNEEIDVMTAPQAIIEEGWEEDWWQPLPVDILESWETTPDDYKEITRDIWERDGEIYFTPGYEAIGSVAVYNEERFEDGIDTWATFWEEELAGDIAMLDTWTYNIYAAAFYTEQNPFDPDDIEEIEEAAAQQQELLATYFGDFSIGQAMMTRQEVDLVVNTAGRAANSHFDDEADHVHYSIPQEGASRTFGSHTIPANAPNPRAALVWLDYFNTGQEAVQMFVGHYVPPVLEGWQDEAADAGVEDEMIEFMDPEVQNVHDAPLYSSEEEQFDSETRDELVSVWERIR